MNFARDRDASSRDSNNGLPVWEILPPYVNPIQYHHKKYSHMRRDRIGLSTCDTSNDNVVAHWLSVGCTRNKMLNLDLELKFRLILLVNVEGHGPFPREGILFVFYISLLPWSWLICRWSQALRSRQCALANSRSRINIENRPDPVRQPCSNLKHVEY